MLEMEIDRSKTLRPESEVYRKDSHYTQFRDGFGQQLISQILDIARTQITNV
jgi:hypothetical protein